MAVSAFADARQFLFRHPHAVTDLDDPVKLVADLVFEHDRAARDQSRIIEGLKDRLEASRIEKQRLQAKLDEVNDQLETLRRAKRK